MAREYLRGCGEGSWGGCKGDEMELKDASSVGLFLEVMEGLIFVRGVSGVEIGSEVGIKVFKNTFLTRHGKYKINSDCKNIS